MGLLILAPLSTSVNNPAYTDPLHNYQDSIFDSKWVKTIKMGNRQKGCSPKEQISVINVILIQVFIQYVQKKGA